MPFFKDVLSKLPFEHVATVDDCAACDRIKFASKHRASLGGIHAAVAQDGGRSSKQEVCCGTLLPERYLFVFESRACSPLLLCYCCTVTAGASFPETLNLTHNLL